MVMVRGKVDFLTFGGLAGGQGLWEVTRLREAVAVLSGSSGGYQRSTKRSPQLSCSRYRENPVCAGSDYTGYTGAGVIPKVSGSMR